MNNNSQNIYDLRKIRVILNKYDIDNSVKELICHNYNNIENFINNYGELILTENINDAIKRDSDGKYFSLCIVPERIKAFSTVFNNIEYPKYLKKYILNIKFNEILNKYKNVSVKEILYLSYYVYDIDYFIKYLTILNKSDQETKELILNIIKPFSKLKLDNSEERVKWEFYGIIDYITNNEISNNIDLNKKMHVNCWIIPNKKRDNIFFFKEFEYFFVELINLINEIVNKNNSKETLKKLYNLKKYIYEHRPSATGKITSEQIYKTYYTEGNPFSEIDTEGGYVTNYKGIKTTDTIDFKQKNIMHTKKILTLFLPSLISDNVDYKKVIKCIIEDNNNLSLINQLFYIINGEYIYDAILKNIETQKKDTKVNTLTLKKQKLN